jgi:AcrR family transcriptional regulator
VSLRERKQQKARDAIVAAAYELFAERGFAQVTVADIAERAEVGRTTFFRYFGDKQEVLFADEQALLDGLADIKERKPAPKDLREAVTQLWDLTATLGELIIGSKERYGEHERLLAANPELEDRVNRKLQRIAEALEDVLLARGTTPELAVLAGQIAIACFRAARRAAGEDPEALLPAMRRAVDLLLA